MCINRPLRQSSSRWLLLSLALFSAASISENQAAAQAIPGGVPAGNTQWNVRQQDAGYAARPMYSATDARPATPVHQQQPRYQQAPPQQYSQQTQQQLRQGGFSDYGQVPGGRGMNAGPQERIALRQTEPRLDAAQSNTEQSGGAQWRETSIVKELNSEVEKMEMTVSTSRILTIPGKFTRAQVNNPEVLNVTPLATNELQVSALKPGVTQVHLWDDSKRVYSVDIAVYGDVQELEMALHDQYPYSAVQVHRYSNSLVLSGYVDRPDYVSSIVRLSEDYAPKVINNMKVGGVQQILLNVQVMEVSRTKLREMGFDFANLNGDDFIISSISGLISAAGTQTGTATGSGTSDTVRFGIVDGSNKFFGFLKLLRQNSLAKILAEPKLVTVSGRPASFNVGGEIPVPVPQSLGSVTIQYKKYGTQVDFLPIVLGNGNIRLEVRPRISELDPTNSVPVNGFLVPAIKERMIDTGVEMKAGQTLALAGLVQNRVETNNRGIPVLADLPWVGAAFRSVHHQNNEIELLIMVRPELVQAMDPHEVPQGGPGLNTVDPCDTDLYWRGHLEVPRCAGCNSGDCQDCADRRSSQAFQAAPMGQQYTPVNHPNSGQQSVGHPDPYAGQQRGGAPTGGRASFSAAPRQPQQQQTGPSLPVYVSPTASAPTQQQSPASPRTAYSAAQGNPQMPRNRYEPVRQPAPGTSTGTPGMIGPLGYDVVK